MSSSAHDPGRSRESQGKGGLQARRNPKEEECGSKPGDIVQAVPIAPKEEPLVGGVSVNLKTQGLDVQVDTRIPLDAQLMQAQARFEILYAQWLETLRRLEEANQMIGYLQASLAKKEEAKRKLHPID